MYPINIKHNKLLFTHLCRLMSNGNKSHYDVLNLQRNCTDKEIKEAFIKLSKELHPDRTQGATHDAFVRVMEAYNVLGKRHSRAQYDANPAPHMHTHAHTDTNSQYGRKRGPRTFYTSETDYTNSAGARQDLRRSNTRIVLLCFSLASVGFLIQLWLIMMGANKRRERQEEQSKAAAEHLARVRGLAITNGNDLQTQIMLERVSAGASRTAATAALADTLAHK